MDEKPNVAPPAPAKADVQPPALAPAKKLTADELVRKHIVEVAPLEPSQHPENHRLVSEHAEEAKLERWQLRTLIARFHAHGLHIHARIHPEVFKAALDEALHGGL
jgi:hypothetical protein